MDLTLEDYFVSYPDTSDPLLQQKIGAKKEFQELRSTSKDLPPRIRGDLYKHQRLVQRYMRFNDELLIIDEPGTGKTCTVAAVTEFFNLNRSNYKRAYILVKGEPTWREMRNQLICRCTPGYYETPDLKAATSTQSQNRKITKILDKWYTIVTYRKFLNDIRGEYWYTDADGNSAPDVEKLKEDFSDSIFWFDEFHNLRPDEEVDSTSKSQKKDINYDTLKILFQSILRSKKILSSATPMINEASEIKDVIDLLLPRGKEFPKNFDYDHITAQDLFPYLNGKIHYIRSLETIVAPSYQGQMIGDVGTNVNTGESYQYQTIVYPTEMSEMQSEAYLAAAEDEIGKASGGVRIKSRQAANFVFPPENDGDIGLVGNDGFPKYIVGSEDNYIPTPDFVVWIKSVNGIRQCSCKYGDFIQRLRDRPDGIYFVYSEFVTGSGIVVLSLCLEHALGYERFTESVSIFPSTEKMGFCQTPADSMVERVPREGFVKKNRYGLLTKQLSNLDVLMGTLNSYENRYGDYIRVLMSSPIGRDGINLANVKYIENMDSNWNHSSTYQAESRGIRATSHIYLYREKQEEYMALYGMSDVPPIEVEVRRHCAIPMDRDRDSSDSGSEDSGSGDRDSVTGHGDRDSGLTESVNISMYKLSEDKDRRIRKVMRTFRELSVTCWLHYERNVRQPPDKDGTAVCDYDVCRYSCFNDPPDGALADTSTYDVLYVDEIITEIQVYILDFFSFNFKVDINTLHRVRPFNGYAAKYIDLALDKTITDKTIITDRFGLNCFLREYNGMLFLSREYMANKDPEADYALSVYLSSLNLMEPGSIPDYIHEISKDLSLPSKVTTDYLESLDIKSKIELVEAALTAKVTTSVVADDNDNFILEHFKSFWYIINDINVEGVLRAIKENKPGFKGTGRGQGRPPKGPPTVKKLTERQLKAIQIPDDTPMVYLHNMDALTIDTAAKHNRMSKFFKVEGKIRVMKPATDTATGHSPVWRDTTIEENIAYNAVLQKKLSEESTFTQTGISGIIKDGVFMIVDKTTENPLAKEKRNMQHSGRDCNSWSIPNLIDILWKLRIGVPGGAGRHRDDQDVDIENMQMELEDHKINTDNMSPEQIKFYYSWRTSGLKKDRYCEAIRSHLAENGKLFET